MVPRKRAVVLSCWGDRRSTKWIILASVLFEFLGPGAGQCKDESLCSFWASEGECENEPDHMLEACPRACKNPCKCSGVSNDTACDCLVKAKEGYCNTTGAMTDCRTTCTRVTQDSCPLLSVPDDPNAHLSSWSTNYLTIVTEVCNQGFTPVNPDDQGKKTCSTNSRWVVDASNGNPVQCTLIDCGSPPSSPNTFHVAVDTNYGSTADYACAQGYVPLQGSLALTCNASGLWEGELLTCKKSDCGQPPASPHSSIKVSNTNQGGTATYTCSLGYRRVQGDVVLTCSSSLVWSGTLIVCKETDCGAPPALDHTQVHVGNMTFGSTANYSCLAGHVQLQGQNSLTCNASGVWSGNPLNCSKIDCGLPPTSPNVLVSVLNTSYNDVANYVCSAGYVYVKGDTTLTCASDGKWNGTLMKCQELDCGQPPSVADSTVLTHNTLYGDRANYTCSPGCLYKSGDVSLVCGVSGTWEGNTISCQKLDCGQPPSVANSTVLTHNNTFYGDRANYTCSPGYIYKSGDVSLVCDVSGTWEGTIISCQKLDCGQPPSVANSTVLTHNNTFYGDRANYTCSPGYLYKSGDVSLVCGVSGTWEGTTISCQRLDCGPAPNAANADISVADTSYRDTANYTCAPGYTQVAGNMTLTCGPSGKWEGVLITCQKKNCGKPPDGSQASVSVTDTFYGGIANYTCLAGYNYIQGDITLICGTSGSWQGVVITCQRKDCGTPTFNNLTSVSYTSTLFGSQVVYTCFVGHERISGDVSRTCLEHRQWSGFPLLCSPVVCGPAPSYQGARQTTGQGVGSFQYKDRVEYECVDEQEGREGLRWVMECGPDKTWVGKKPQCGAIDPASAPSSHPSTVEAPAAWAIGVGIFAIVATVVVLAIVLDLGAIRKRYRRRRTSDNKSRNRSTDTSPSSLHFNKWRPSVASEGYPPALPPASFKLPESSLPTSKINSRRPSVSSFKEPRPKPDNSNNKETSSNLTVPSRHHSQLTTPRSSLLTPRTSITLPKSPSSITLNSLLEPTASNTMTTVGS